MSAGSDACSHGVDEIFHRPKTQFAAGSEVGRGMSAIGDRPSRQIICVTFTASGHVDEISTIFDGCTDDRFGGTVVVIDQVHLQYGRVVGKYHRSNESQFHSGFMIHRRDSLEIGNHIAQVIIAEVPKSG